MTSQIHLWLSGLEAEGGIQLYSRFFLRCLRDTAYLNECSVLLKNDRDPDLEFQDDRILRCGKWPEFIRTVPFASTALARVYFQRPRLIIAGHANFAVLASFLKSHLGIPYWVIVYGLEVWDERGAKVSASLKKADRLISISSFTRDRLIGEQKIASNAFRILPTTFDAARLQPAPKPQALFNKLGLSETDRVILTVCRLAGGDRYKGYDQVIRALPRVMTEVPGVHYVIVGRGEDRQRIEKVIGDLHLEARVHLAGYVPDQELVDYYNLCDVFAMPSKMEGFGIVYLEAMACGKPVLAGNKDGSVDALCGGEFGALVDPDNVEEVAEALIQILRGTYPNPLMYQPVDLRNNVLERFGFARFRETLHGYLQEFEKGNAR